MTILKNRYAHVIFDWDGTLMDSTARIVSAMQATARNLKIKVPSEASVKSIIGLSMDAVLDNVFPEACTKTRSKILEEYRFQYIEGDKTPTPLFDGTMALLNWLRGEGIFISVATGKARHGLDRVMTEVGLESFFDLTICADEASSKPSPHMVEILLEKSGTLKEETVVVGDSTHDLKMARNAGVESIAVTSGADEHESLMPHQPIVILDRVCSLKNWLEN